MNSHHPVFTTVLGCWLVLFGWSCSSDKTPSLSGTADSPRAQSVPKLLSSAKLTEYRDALPEFANPEISRIVRDPNTLWYDKEVMIPSYEDSVGDGFGTPIGARANSAGKPIIVPEGKKFFSEDGSTWSFPFGHTAGTDDSDNVHIADFVSLPANGNSVYPIVYWTIDEPSGRGGLGYHKWSWMYPKSTVVGELVFIRHGGRLYPIELRTRTRTVDAWTTNVYRPFPTAQSLAEVIKEKRPDWQNRLNLRALVQHLENRNTLVAKSVRSPGFNNVLTLSGGIDTLPDFGDETLVEELLTSTPFVSAYGSVWKENGAMKTYAASTAASFSIVPKNYFAGLIEVSDNSCQRCHSLAGKPLEDYEPATVLYGDMWGEDRIFSFHPYDETRYVIFNNENRQVRPSFANARVVERYDRSIHRSDMYNTLSP